VIKVHTSEGDVVRFSLEALQYRQWEEARLVRDELVLTV